MLINITIMALIPYCFYVLSLIFKADKKMTLEEQAKRNLTKNYWGIS